MWTAPSEIRYQIIAQCRNNKLMINILGKRLHFMRSAQQIFNTPTLLNGFSQEEAALIGYIVGTEQAKQNY